MSSEFLQLALLANHRTIKYYNRHDMDVLLADAHRFIHNQEHVSARFLRELRRETNVDEETWAVGICGVISIYLLLGDQAQVMANFLLTMIPIFWTYVFVNECPSNDLLLLHWTCFGISTLVDPIFDQLQGYYFFKVLFFAMLYFRPCLLSEKLLVCLRDLQSYGSSIVSSASSASDLPARTERTQMSVTSRSYQPSLAATSAETVRQPVRTFASDSTAPLEVTSPARSPAFKIEDAMICDPRHALTPSTPNGSYAPDEMDPTQPQMPIAFNDLLFEPREKIVFNAPFDEHTLTYYMSIYSKATRNIAFAIKSNAIPRVTAIPPYGILKPRTKQIIAVSVQKFDYETEKPIVDRDRIAFDYVFCGPEIVRFSHHLFQGHEMRRRKNIKIAYNP